MKLNSQELKLIAVVAVTAFIVCGVSNYFIFQKEVQQKDPEKWLEGQLELTDKQEQLLADIEKRYDQRKAELEAKIHTANAELATAILQDKQYSVRVKKAQALIHGAQGELQRATLMHFFEIQPHLTPKQRETLNTMAVNALYHNP